ncbi:MAG: GGDEF domain-containing protein [Burkholderiales bacterium]|nr:GGDEF domain-containing protein [Burkholderiales bacterium]
MQVDLIHGQWAFISTKPAERRDIRRALVAMAASLLFFLAAAPFAKTPLGQVPAFIPVYVSWLVICDLITAVLLFGQFSVLRSTAILVLASGYLFTASVTFAYALIFPGLFELPGVPRAGPQTSSAMYMFWHAGFPLFVMAYTRFTPRGASTTSASGGSRGNAHLIILCAVAEVFAITFAYTLFATWGQALLPVFLDVNRTTNLGHAVLSGVWLLSLLALALLGRRKPHTALDVWLMVVLCVWLFDIGLGAILNTGRYDLGWYAGRIYGMVAASFLLIVLLMENAKQYAQLVQVSVELRAANTALAQLSRHDGLTGLANRRSLDEYLSEQTALASRHQRMLTLVMCDVDHFKAYNDHYGHQAGDDCLRLVATALKSCCARPADMAARYGGEEFTLILPDTDAAGGTQVAESARQAVVRLKIPHAHSSTGTLVSISCGVAVLRHDTGMTAQELITAADRCLYQAKHAGRNRVVCTG